MFKMLAIINRIY